MKARWILIFVLALAIVGLTACSGGNEGKTSNATPNMTWTPGPTWTNTPDYGATATQQMNVYHATLTQSWVEDLATQTIVAATWAVPTMTADAWNIMVTQQAIGTTQTFVASPQPTWLIGQGNCVAYSIFQQAAENNEWQIWVLWESGESTGYTNTGIARGWAAADPGYTWVFLPEPSALSLSPWLPLEPCGMQQCQGQGCG